MQNKEWLKDQQALEKKNQQCIQIYIRVVQFIRSAYFLEVNTLDMRFVFSERNIEMCLTFQDFLTQIAAFCMETRKIN